MHVISTTPGRGSTWKNIWSRATPSCRRAIAEVITNVDGAFGTNVSFDGIRAALTELQMAYRERGFVTVSVGLPQQKLTNAEVNVQVTEGRLAAINVKGNHYFSSNNVMRALPEPAHQHAAELPRLPGANSTRPTPATTGKFIPSSAPARNPAPANSRSRSRTSCRCTRGWNSTTSARPARRICAPISTPNTTTSGSWNIRSGLQYGFSPDNYKTATIYFLSLRRSADCQLRRLLSSAARAVTFGGGAGRRESRQLRLQRNHPQFQLPPPTGRPELTILRQPFHLRHRCEIQRVLSIYVESAKFADARSSDRRRKCYAEPGHRRRAFPALAALDKLVSTLSFGPGFQALSGHELQRRTFFTPSISTTNSDRR